MMDLSLFYTFSFVLLVCFVYRCLFAWSLYASTRCILSTPSCLSALRLACLHLLLGIDHVMKSTLAFYIRSSLDDGTYISPWMTTCNDREIRGCWSDSR